MADKIVISIPTYWTCSNIPKEKQEVYFDHPTCLNSEETLSRLLESLKNLPDYDFSVSIILATTNNSDRELLRKAREAVEDIIKPFSQFYPVYLSDYTNLSKIRQSCPLEDDLKNGLGMDNYGQIRNLQIIAANALNADIMIGLDDDEVIEDPEFVDKCIRLVNSRSGDIQVRGGGGFYLDKNGRTHVEKMDTPPSDNIFYCKSFIKNKGFIDVFNKKEDIVKANFVFGGCLVLHKDFFREVCYDPAINRGENMDYLINARMKGLNMYLDKTIRIVHLPPHEKEKDTKGREFLNTGAHSSANFEKLEQDIKRFIYEREKIHIHNMKNPLVCVEIDDLMPYPGKFYNKALYEDALCALQNLFPEKGLKKEYCEKFLNDITGSTGKNIKFYERFSSSWGRILDAFNDKNSISEEYLKV